MILLDTCAIIFASEDRPISDEASLAIDAAYKKQALYVSPISAWEIGSLGARGRLALATDPVRYFQIFLEKSGCRLCDMGYELLIASNFLPGVRHKDPTDRILIESARRFGFTLITRDRAILTYGAAGHVKTLAC